MDHIDLASTIADRDPLDAESRIPVQGTPGLTIPRFLSCRTVARRLDVSLAWVRVWHREGLIRGYVLHATPGDRGRLLFLESDVKEFLEKRGLPVDDDAR